MPDRITPVEERLGEPPPRQPQAADERLNAVIAGQYRVEEKIGDGGMGTVYKCTDLAVNRIVAVKILHPHLIATSKWFLRFQQEAKAIARLQHPNIINMHHFSPDEDAPFIVMDYVSGWALSEVLAHSGKLSIERSLNIVGQVADALCHAHTNGVVHRDLKPSNIMIIDLTDDEVKILDFGIAQIADEKANLTQTGEVFGSPAYMSPEQCEGKRIDARSDQYSLGCVLFECLTGTPPFAASSSIHVMMQQINETPPTLKEASLGQTFPENLEYTVKKLLAKNPGDRFVDMDEAIRTLRGRPASAYTEPAKESDKRSSGVLVATITVLALALTAVLVFFLFLNKPSTTVVEQPVNPPMPVNWTEQNSSVEANSRFVAAVAIDPRQRELEVSEKSITDDVIPNLGQLPLLERLDLSACQQLTDQGMKNLAQLKLRNLSSLSLKGDPIGDEGMSAIAQQYKNLRHLQLTETNITDKGIEALSRLKSLEALNLSSVANLTPEALKFIAKMTALTSLKLTHDRNVVAGLHYLTKCKLQQLDVGKTALTDKDVQSIAQIESLTKLNLQNTDISDQSVTALGKLKKLKLLKVYECINLSKAGLSRLRGALPNCTVTDTDDQGW